MILVAITRTCERIVRFNYSLLGSLSSPALHEDIVFSCVRCYVLGDPLSAYICPLSVWYWCWSDFSREISIANWIALFLTVFNKTHITWKEECTTQCISQTPAGVIKIFPGQFQFNLWSQFEKKRKYETSINHQASTLQIVFALQFNSPFQNK